MSAAQPRTIYASTLRGAAAVAADLRATAQQDPARARTAAPPLPDLEPIAARVGVATWGQTQPSGA